MRYFLILFVSTSRDTIITISLCFTWKNKIINWLKLRFLLQLVCLTIKKHIRDIAFLMHLIALVRWWIFSGTENTGSLKRIPCLSTTNPSRLENIRKAFYVQNTKTPLN